MVYLGKKASAVYGSVLIRSASAAGFALALQHPFTHATAKSGR